MSLLTASDYSRPAPGRAALASHHARMLMHGTTAPACLSLCEISVLCRLHLNQRQAERRLFYSCQHEGHSDCN